MGRKIHLSKEEAAGLRRMAEKHGIDPKVLFEVAAYWRAGVEPISKLPVKKEDRVKASEIRDTLAPWSLAQVEALNTYQRLGYVHEFTCPNDGCVLLATQECWICPRTGCGYVQRWAPDYMTDKSKHPKNPMEFLMMRGGTRECDECGANAVSKWWQTQQMPIRFDDGAEVIFEVRVPVWTCGACGEAYTDHEGEEIRDRFLADLRRAYNRGREKGAL